MARLEDLTAGSRVQGVLPHTAVTVVSAEWHGTDCVSLYYRDDDGGAGQTLLFRQNEQELRVTTADRV